MKRLTVILNILFCLLLGAQNIHAQVAVGVSVRVAPPVIPVYVQPACPVEGYIWEPGYWAYGDNGYYWVPGVWIAPPAVGLLWTPGYWGFVGGFYGWHRGYWGPHVGFYGGVAYGFGYTGVGFCGGRWEGGAFRYNTAVWHVNSAVVHNTYVDRTVINNTSVSHASFNGPGGVNARPTSAEQAAMNEHHVQPTAQQTAHQQAASTNRSQLASVNGGHPSTTAMSSVHGRQYNTQGHSISSTPRTAATQASNVHSSAPQQHSAVQNRSVPQQPHSNMQSRSMSQQPRNAPNGSRMPPQPGSGRPRQGGNMGGGGGREHRFM